MIRKFVFLWVMVIAVLFMAGPGFCENDAEGCKENPYFSRMPSFRIDDCADKEFEAYKFFDGKKIVSVEGRLYQTQYTIDEGKAKPSPLQIRRNYSNAVKKMGGSILFEGPGRGFNDPRDGSEILWGKVTKGSRELWLEVMPGGYGDNYQVVIIDKEAMKQDVSAGDLLKALNTDGHVALYINFDVAKASIKPESEPIIDQIAQMLKESPALMVVIEGHTDNTGDRQKNKVLSEQRAKSVLAAIVKRGVDSKRLTSAGFGQDKPIADNATEQGKAKNRRVELVKK